MNGEAVTRPGAGCIRRVGRLIIARDDFPLALGQVRVPHVEDQDRPQLVAVVPGLMFDRVVEREWLADDPRPDLAADPETAALRNDQRQVDDRPRVGDAGMRWDALCGFSIEKKALGARPGMYDTGSDSSTFAVSGQRSSTGCLARHIPTGRSHPSRGCCRVPTIVLADPRFHPHIWPQRLARAP